MELDEIKAVTARLSNYAHIATIGADGKPDVVPVWPAWEEDTVWFMTHAGSVKVRNISANPDVAMSWQVDDNGDCVEAWGSAKAYDDMDTKRRLWTGVFSYNLDDFVSNGIESPEARLVAVAPERIIFVKQFGMGGIESWQRD